MLKILNSLISLIQVLQLITFMQTDTHQQLDNYFVQALNDIQSKYHQLSKHLQIRIQMWVQKLILHDSNLSFKRNRNNYIKLLQIMVNNHHIEHPFDKMPLDNTMPIIHQYQLQNNINHKINNNHIKKPTTSNKIISAKGDNSVLATPYPQTQRQLVNSTNLQADRKVDRLQAVKLLQQMGRFLRKYQKSLLNNNEYRDLVEQLDGIGEDSVQLQVEEGIEKNRKNMFEGRSPRGGLTQIQYFKDQFKF